MRLDSIGEKGYLYMKDDLEGNVESMENRDDEIRYGYDSKFTYVCQYLLLMVNEMENGIKTIELRCEKDRSTS